MDMGIVAECVLERLRAHMAEQQLAACVVSHPIHVGYLSGYFAPADRFSALLVTPREAILVAPGSPALGQELRVIAYEDYSGERAVDPIANAAQAFQDALGALPSRAVRIGIERTHLPASFWELLRTGLVPAQVRDIGPMLQQMRMVKSAGEVRAVERAAATCDRIFAAIEAEVCAGASELDVYLIALQIVAQEAGGPAVLDGDFVSGERAQEIGGPPTARVLRRGDLLIVDVYPRLGAYWADCTRTYVLGQPTQAMIDWHGALVEALEAGERAIAPGLPARELYRVVKGVLDRAGLGDHFPHHAGHGIGLTPSENPRFISGSAETILAGMTVTLEPGIYIPGQGGMRIEDNFLVTADGCRCLSRYSRRLIEL